MGNLNLSEIVLLAVLAVIIFGPEKLPELGRKLARVVRFVRNVANNAQDTVRRELGPEYADLQLSDLTPKNLVRRALAEDYEAIEAEIRSAGQAVRGEVDQVRGEVSTLRGEVSTLRDDVEASVLDKPHRNGDDVVAQAVAATTVVVAGAGRVPFDPEAT